MLKFKNINIPYLPIILILALLLRVMFLGTIPNGFFTDEASNAYDAYSILHTLRDQYGEFLPWYFKSANDYREGLYMYLMVPFIKVFGLNPFGARITSAILGTLTVFIVYHLGKEIFNQRIGLLSALFLAILPWHIHFSRTTFRAILLPCLFSLSLLFFVKSFKQPKWLILSSLMLGISIYTYNSARVFIPLFMLGLGVIYWEHLWKNKNYTVLGFLAFLAIFIPQLIYQLSPEGMARADAVGIQTDINKIISDYLSYFSPDFLFFKGDPIPRHTIDRTGELYSFQIPLLIIGIMQLIRDKNSSKWILFLWLFLYPIPAAFISPYSAVRTLAATPLFAILSGYGTIQLIDFCKGKIKMVFTFLMISVIFANLAIYAQRYFVEYPRWHSDVWLSTLEETITYADKTSYDCIVYSSNAYGEYAYIMIPFFTKMPPADYQKLGIDVVENKLDMGRWKVENLEKKIDELNTNCLYLLYNGPNPENNNIIKGKDGEVLSKKYQEKLIYSTRDISGVQQYRLVELKKQS
ncbi:glycosyltransferase family 39 protein [Crocosphaera sp. UHCC 0190]|uniref:ArnT family glycosyltransferase n=1 Tax=Crocosphaera sp. UHCC 0190 TaxID=3110246 RepID=UPI002B207555|nr:glycosyltransferase family 39 protein [Crocosphaera sp. UHCC 0190]MEA5510378.1 glycosyltransferase family 39 protein [Crocosphaera sp. UHCC 0190]